MRRLLLFVVGISIVIQPAGVAAAEAQPTATHSIADAESGPTDSTRMTAAATSEDIVRTMTFRLTPAQPGEVAIELSYSIPDSISELTTSVPETATITGTDGFSQDGTRNYTWDGETTLPSVTFAMPANRTGASQYDQGQALELDTATESEQRADNGDADYTFVDTGSWALVSVPPVSVWWSGRFETSPSLVRQTKTEGEGVAGDRIVFLGPHEVESRSIDGQEMKLVVPSAATLEPSTDAVFSSVRNASRALPVGNKAERMLFIAAPTNVDWGPFGLTDRRDAWIRADQPLADPNNVWLHEYVHIRQDFRTTSDARWTSEAMGEYYAAVLTLQQGRIGFDSFKAHLEKGSDQRYDDTVLSQPETWMGLANYVKGGLVFGNLDREMRLSTDGSAPASRLFRAMNAREDPVDHAFLTREIEALAGAEVRDSFDSAATTTRTPAMWNRSAHTAAFSTLPPRIRTEIGTEYELQGPYRNRSVPLIPTLVPGEQVTVPATVSNEGEAEGTFELALTVEEEPVDTVNGTLSGASNQTVELAHTFSETGNYKMGLGDRTWNVSVKEPAAVDVTAIRGPEETDPGETVPIVVSFANSADRPAASSQPITVDGTATQSWPIRLDVGAESERSLELTFQEPGTHEVKVGEMRHSVRVIEPTTTNIEETTQEAPEDQTDPGTEAAGTETTSPGFGFLIPLSVILLVILFRR